MKLYLKEKEVHKEKDWNNAAAALSQSKKVFNIKKRGVFMLGYKSRLERKYALYTAPSN